MGDAKYVGLSTITVRFTRDVDWGLTGDFSKQIQVDFKKIDLPFLWHNCYFLNRYFKTPSINHLRSLNLEQKNFFIKLT